MARWAAGRKARSAGHCAILRTWHILEKMLTDIWACAFSTRDIEQAVDRAPRRRRNGSPANLIFLRHIENPENVPRQASLQVIFMTQSLDARGRSPRIWPNEVCHVVRATLSARPDGLR